MAPTQGAAKLPPIRELVKQNGDAKRGQVVFAGKVLVVSAMSLKAKERKLGQTSLRSGTSSVAKRCTSRFFTPSGGHKSQLRAIPSDPGKRQYCLGLLTSKTDEKVVITDKEGIAHSFKPSEVEELIKQTVSLMPADLHQLMTQQELADTVEYLETLRKK